MKLDEVNTYSGYRADEKPASFKLGELQLKVNKIIDRWRDPDCDYFKIEASDKATYILKHNFLTDAWEIVFYKSTSGSAP